MFQNGGKLIPVIKRFSPEWTEIREIIQACSKLTDNRKQYLWDFLRVAQTKIKEN